MKSIKEQHEEHERRELERLLEWAGSPGVLAELLDVTPQTVDGWRVRGRISATAAEIADKVTKGKFTKRMLRPDVSTWWSEQK